MKGAKNSYWNITFVRKVFLRIFHNAHRYCTCTHSGASTLESAQTTVQATLDLVVVRYSARLCNHHLEGCFVGLWRSISITLSKHYEKKKIFQTIGLLRKLFILNECGRFSFGYHVEVKVTTSN